MSITSNNLRVREVIHQVVNDPDYPAVSHVPTFSWPQIGLILLAYGGVFGGMALHSYAGWSLWLVYPVMIFCFYVAFTPLHDSTHRAVSSHPVLNDLLGSISGFLLFPMSNTPGYRYLHLAHHRYVGDKNLDPDEPMVGLPTRYFPFGYLALLFPDVIWAHWMLVKAWKRTPVKSRINVMIMIVGNVLFHALWLLSPWGSAYFLLFFIPNRLAIAYTAFAFAHTPHPEGLHWHEHPFETTFQLKGNAAYLKTFLGQEHHAMHHFLPHIPWFKYVKAWDLANGVFRKHPIPEKEVFSRPDLHYKEKVKERATDLTQTRLPVRVLSVEQATPLIKTLVFESIDPSIPLPAFEAGAHIDLYLPSGKVRSYSLLNPSFERNRYQIAVKQEIHGRGGSKEVHEVLQQGATLEISPPRNQFVLYENVQKYLLIAGGIGITPLLSMAHRLNEIDKHFELHICARSEKEVPFAYELQHWTFAPNVEIHFDKHDSTSMDLCKVLASPDADTLIYVCGPTGFSQWVHQTAAELGWAKSQIRQEVFSAAIQEVLPSRAFELKLQKSGKTLTVPADQTIIDVLQLHNIKVPYSCLQGTCGTCITPVVSGKVDHRDAVLSGEAKAKNSHLCLCVSRAKGECLEIEL